VYDVLGREIATLADDVKQPGSNTAYFTLHYNFSSGSYFYQLKA